MIYKVSSGANAIGGHMVTRKTRINKSDEKEYVDSMGIKIANLEDEFC